MNPQEILERARAAIAAGESPDDVARWIQEATGMSIADLVARAAAESRVAASGNPVTDFLHQAVASVWPPGLKGPSPERDTAFHQRTEDLRLLEPDGSTLAGITPLVAAGGVGALRGLGAAGRAIQTARTGAPRATGLLDALGRPVMAPTQRSALEMLRLLGQNPALRAVGRGARRVVPWAGGAAISEAIRRVAK